MRCVYARQPLRAGIGGTLVVVAALAGSDEVLAQSPTTGRQVMELYRAQERTRDSEVTITMRLEDAKGRERRREVILQSKTREDGTRLMLIRFLEPADVRGTGFLTVENAGREDDAWLYLPALRRTRRIAGSDRRDRFVGTDFTFEDLAPEKLDEHDYEFLGEDVVDGRPTWRVRAVPANDRQRSASGYGFRELWISRERHVLLRARLFDSEGTYVRQLTATDVRQLPASEKWRPHRLVMENVREGGRTVLDISEYRIDQGLSDDLFTERYLRRGR